MSQRERPVSQPQLRVIGGEWRGRKLSFPSKGSLRPTTDRVRETLFNWLAPMVIEAQCLDLCAGSGALGIEALSRGAQHCDFVDTDQHAINAIEKNLCSLGATERATLRTCHADTVSPGMPDGTLFLSTRPLRQVWAVASSTALPAHSACRRAAWCTLKHGARHPKQSPNRAMRSTEKRRRGTCASGF